MGLFNIFKKDKNTNLNKQQDINSIHEVSSDINLNYETITSNIVFTDNDKLRIDKNCQIMESLGLPYLKEMKLIPLDSNTNIIGKEDIVKMMVFDLLVGRKALNKMNNIGDVDDEVFTLNAFKYGMKDMYEIFSTISKGEFDNNKLNELAYLSERASVYAYVLGLKNKPNEINISNWNELVLLLSNYNNFDDLISKCNLINNDEIMEYADLITRYEWAMVELKRLNKTSNNINHDCVLEHKKAMDFVTSFNQNIYLEKR